MIETFDLYIIDDDQIVIKKIMSMLSGYKLKIKSFTDPVKGLEQLIQNPPKVIFIDYNMPVLNGKTFVIKMSELYLFQYTSIFLITATELTENETAQFQTLGFSQVIRKPFKTEDLVAALSSTFDLVAKKDAA